MEKENNYANGNADTETTNSSNGNYGSYHHSGG